MLNAADRAPGWIARVGTWSQAQDAAGPARAPLLCLAGLLGQRRGPDADDTALLAAAARTRRVFMCHALGLSPPPKPAPAPDAALPDLRDPAAAVERIAAQRSDGVLADRYPTMKIERLIAAGIGACRANEQARAALILRLLCHLGLRGAAGTRTLFGFLRTAQAADGSFGLNEAAYAKLSVTHPEAAPALIVALKAELSFQTAWALIQFETGQDPATVRPKS